MKHLLIKIIQLTIQLSNRCYNQQMSSKQNTSVLSSLQPLLPTLSQLNSNLSQSKDISGSMVNLTSTLNTMQPLLQAQTHQINNFFSGQYQQNNHVTPQMKQSENRRMISRICQIAIHDVDGMLKVCEDYCSLEFRDSWAKIRANWDKQFNTAREDVNQKNIVEFLFKIINLKDWLVSIMINSFIYRKMLLWNDLNIAEQGYLHAIKTQISTQIDSFLLKKSHIPTKPVFQSQNLSLNVKGLYSMNKLENQNQNDSYSLHTILKIANEQIQSAFTVLRNYGNLNKQQLKHQDIDRNREKVKSLRDQIQQGRIAYLNLQKKYRQAVLKDEKGDLVQLKQRVASLEELLEQKQSQIKQIRFESRDSSTQITTLKQKIHELQSDLSRVTNMQLKKLKQIEGFQSSLMGQFEKIHKNITNFGSMFEFESDGKKQLVREIKSKQKMIEGLVNMLGKEKNKNRQMNQEIERLGAIVLQLGAKIREKR